MMQLFQQFDLPQAHKRHAILSHVAHSYLFQRYLSICSLFGGLEDNSISSLPNKASLLVLVQFLPLFAHWWLVELKLHCLLFHVLAPLFPRIREIGSLCVDWSPLGLPFKKQKLTGNN